jgi:hypothetical protein
MVSVNSDVFPTSTAPKFRLPPSDITLVAGESAADVEAGVEAGVGAVGLALSQAEHASATRNTTRPSERTRKRSGIEPYSSQTSCRQERTICPTPLCVFGCSPIMNFEFDRRRPVL